jgi:hypothetical protein
MGSTFRTIGQSPTDQEGARRERHQIRLPTVQVAGEGDTSAATVAVAQRALELAKPAAV